MKKMRKTLLFIAICLLTACGEDTKYNTYYPCNFVFFTNLYPTSALSRAVASPGEFVIVKPAVRQGVTHLLLTPNHGKWASTDLDLAMQTAIGNERLNYAAMGAARGLIIGCSNFFGLKAYDLQCPNCLAQYNTPKQELSWTNDGNQLECKLCHRIYQCDNDDGIIVGGGAKGDKSLIQYRTVTYNQAEGRLFVHN